MAGAEYEYFQFKETPKSLEEKKWVGLEALTPGSEFDASSPFCRSSIIKADSLFAFSRSARILDASTFAQQRLLPRSLRQG